MMVSGASLSAARNGQFRSERAAFWSLRWGRTSAGRTGAGAPDARVESTAIRRRFDGYFTQLPTLGRAFAVRYSGRASLGPLAQAKREGRHSPPQPALAKPSVARARHRRTAGLAVGLEPIDDRRTEGAVLR